MQILSRSISSKTQWNQAKVIHYTSYSFLILRNKMLVKVINKENFQIKKKRIYHLKKNTFSELETIE